MSEKKIPDVRFDGFSDDWEQRKLGSLLIPLDEKISNSRIPIATSSRSGLYLQRDYFDGTRAGISPNLTFHRLPMGYITYRHMSDDGFFHFNLNDFKTDILVSKEYPVFKVKENTNKIFILSYLNHSMHFRKYALLQKKGGTRTRLYYKILVKHSLKIPILKEQQAIGLMVTAIENAIASNQKKVDQLKTLKKLLLQKIFDQEWRFKGFTDPWEQRKLSQMVTPITREVTKPDKPYFRISIRSHAKGTFHTYVDDPQKVAMDKLFVVRTDDLIVNITFAWEHAIAVANPNDDGLYVSHRFPTYRINKADVNFVRYLVSRELFRHKMALISPGGAGRNRVLNKNNFLNLVNTVPTCSEEQVNIGRLLRKLDDLIASNQKKIDQLKQTKKWLLQNLFV